MYANVDLYITYGAHPTRENKSICKKLKKKASVSRKHCVSGKTKSWQNTATAPASYALEPKTASYDAEKSQIKFS